MKRQLKFRAWHKAEKKMAEVETINFDKGAFLSGIEQGDDVICNKYVIPAPKHGRFCEFDEFELMQFTGLLDKNGKEVWEGDVVRLCNTSSTYDGDLFSVGFRIGSFELQSDPSLPPLSFIYLAVQLRNKLKIEKDTDTESYIEVIGNIHENPELL